MKSEFSLLWVTDADNTLWDTDAVYREAQLTLLVDVEQMIGLQASTQDRLAYLREVDQSIAEMHHSGLKYPVELLARGLGLRLRGKSSMDAASCALREGIIGADLDVTVPSERFAANLRNLPALRVGVRAGFRTLSQVDAKVVVATEGSKARIERLLEEFDLRAQVDTCLEAPKTRELFIRLSRRSPRRFPWMIGDQLDRDILPAKAAHYSTVYFPGGFSPRWHRPEHELEAATVVSSYDAGVRFAVASLEGSMHSC